MQIPENIQNQIADWRSQLEDAVKKQKVEKPEIHLVLYTDGGCQPVPRGQGGWGVHGYYYTNNKLKVGQGFKGFSPTGRGYVNHAGANELGDDRTVAIAAYVDCVGSIIPSSTNNEAELVAMIRALQIVIGTKPTSVHFRLDSKYVLDGIQQSMDAWFQMGWRKSDGAMVANDHRWRELRELYREALSVCPISMDWVKGHSDDVGNRLADWNATSGVYAGNKGMAIDRLTLSSHKKYWAPEANYNRYLAESRWYFNTGRGSGQVDDFYVYHMGNADEEELGKPLPDVGYVVVMLRSADPVLETIREYQREVSNGFSHMCTGLLMHLFKPRIYNSILTNGRDYLRQAETKMDVYDYSKTQLTHLAEPVRLAYRAEQTLLDMELMLRDLRLRNIPKDWRLTDITSVIYEEAVVKDEPTLKVTLPNGQEGAAIKVDVDFYHRDVDQVIKAPLTLTVGVDTPRRNFFAATAGGLPTVYVVTWPEACSRPAFRYVVLVETADGECGLWSGAHSNLYIAPESTTNRG